MTGEGAMNAAAVLLGELGGTVVSVEDKMKLASLWMQWAMESENLQMRNDLRDGKVAPWGIPQMPVGAAKSQEESND